MASNLTIIGSSKGNPEENNNNVRRLRAHYEEQWNNLTAFRGGGCGGGGVSEIEEEFSTTADELFNHDGFKGNPLGTIREEAAENSGGAFSGGGGDDVVYVVVGNQADEKISMDALIWTLNNVVANPSSAVVFLVHVFPETKLIPTPLGKIPVSQVNPEQKEVYMAQERGKKRDYLQKFLNACSASQVKVDTILIESDMEAKAMLDLIPILNIRKLILGATKSTVRRILRSKKGNGVADQIVQNVPEFCEVKIICEGKEISELTLDSQSPSPAPSPRGSTNHPAPTFAQDQQQTRPDSVACGCFRL